MPSAITSLAMAGTSPRITVCCAMMSGMLAVYWEEVDEDEGGGARYLEPVGNGRPPDRTFTTSTSGSPLLACALSSDGHFAYGASSDCHIYRCLTYPCHFLSCSRVRVFLKREVPFAVHILCKLVYTHTHDYDYVQISVVFV